MDKVQIHVLEPGKPYVLGSAAQNLLLHTGCGFLAESWGYGSVSACLLSPCPAAEENLTQLIGYGECNGVGCCYALMPGSGLASFTTQFVWSHHTDGGSGTVNPPSTRRNVSLVVVEINWLSSSSSAVKVKKLKENLLHGKTTGIDIPAILDWSFDNSTSWCGQAKMRHDYGCASANSDCLVSKNSARGYVCRCGKGYDGNPYIPGGCQSPNHRSTGN
jgi:hypothetical protein